MWLDLVWTGPNRLLIKCSGDVILLLSEPCTETQGSPDRSTSSLDRSKRLAYQGVSNCARPAIGEALPALLEMTQQRVWFGVCGKKDFQS